MEKTPGASYCFGQYNEKNVIYRIANGNTNCIASTIRTKQVIPLPPINRLYAQTLYIKNRGLFVIGGCKDKTNSYLEVGDYSFNNPSNKVWQFNESERKWHNDMIKQMKTERYAHLSLYYEPHQYDISDKIFF